MKTCKKNNDILDKFSSNIQFDIFLFILIIIIFICIGIIINNKL